MFIWWSVRSDCKHHHTHNWVYIMSSDSQTAFITDSHFRRQQNHEWPPTKEDSHHSGFTSHSKPVQVHTHTWRKHTRTNLWWTWEHVCVVQGLEEQNWYVGAFSRVDSEHALHLVNQVNVSVFHVMTNEVQIRVVIVVWTGGRLPGARLLEEHYPWTLRPRRVLRQKGFQHSNSFLWGDQQIHSGDRTQKQWSKFWSLHLWRESIGSSGATAVPSSVFQRFDSVTDIIKFHSIFPIILIDGRKMMTASNPRRHCVLMYPVTKQDLTELLR